MNGCIPRSSFLVSVVVLVLLAPAPVGACFCEPPDVLTAYEEALAVFEGRAVEEITVDGFLRTRFEVFRVWKGPLDPDAFVHTYENNGANCGLSFQIGEDYLVYGMPADASFFGEDALYEDSCGRTKLLSMAEVLDYPVFEDAGIGSVVSAPSGSWGAVKALYAGGPRPRLALGSRLDARGDADR